VLCAVLVAVQVLCDVIGSCVTAVQVLCAVIGGCVIAVQDCRCCVL